MKSFPNSKTKGFHTRFPKASKKLTDDYHTSSIQIFPRMILFNSITGEHALLQFCCFIASSPRIFRASEKSPTKLSLFTIYSVKKSE